MAYNKRVWGSDEVITKEALNNIENGIEAVEQSIPKKTSQLVNDSGYITEHLDLSNYAEKDELHEHNNKDVLDGINLVRMQSWDNAANVNLDNYVKKDAEWQKYKLTNDDGTINYITTDNLNMLDLEPGNYACIASRFINPPIPEDGGYVDISVRKNVNNKGEYIRKVYTVHYIYSGRTFIGYVHHEHNYIHWEEITEKPLPTQEFLRTEINRVLTRTRQYLTDTSKNIGFITDTHYVKDARGKNSSRGLDHIKNCVSICGDGAADLIVHGGDIIHGSYSAIYSLQAQFLDTNHAMLNSHVPIFPCKGNHDNGLVWSINSGDTDFEKVFITNKEWHDLITDRFIRKFGFVGDSNNPHNNYAYYDFDDVKLRCIMLDTEDLEKKHVTDADGKISLDEEDGSMVFRVSPKQLNWLANEALNFEDKDGESWSVMLFSHVTIYSPYTENITRITNGKHIHQILKSLKEHSTYTFSVEGENITCDFTNTNHKVIAGVAGHYHTDLVLVKDGILYVTCKQSRCDYNVYTDPGKDDEYRALGDPEHEDSWTIFTVDPAERQVVLTRFGSGKGYEQVFKLDELQDTTVFPGEEGTENDEDETIE
jgi:hypothetical protein